MKKKSLLIALILIAIISITTCVNAATWGGQTTPVSTVNGTRTVTGATLSLTFGEVDGSGNLITRLNIPLSSDENQAGTIKAGCPANHYTMSLDNADSNGVVTGLDSTQTQNGNEKLIVNAQKTGTQTIHIITRNTSDDWPAGVNAYDNIVNVISYYSTNFQNAASALDITFNGNNTVYYSDNVNIYPEDNSKFEAILNAKSKYDALNPYEKQRLDSIIATASNGNYANYTALYNAADNYLTNLARTFITSTSVNGLKGNTVANKDNCEIIINAQTEYDNLKDIVKNRVNLILTSDPSSVYGGYSSVNYPTLLVQAKAYKFIKTYSIDTPDGNLSKLNDEKILDSEINSDYKWDNLESNVKGQVNSFLNSAVGRYYVTQMSFVRNHLEQTLADSFVDNTFFSEYEELAGTKSLRNYNKNTELNQEITDKYENLAKKITGDVNTEYNSITSNQYVNETSLKQKIDNEIANTNYAPILDAAQDYLDDLEEARNFVSDHKLNDELTAEIAEDIITLENAITDTRVKAMVEEMIGKTMEQKIQEADDFLTELATQFVNDNKLNTDFNTILDKDDLDNKETIANDIKELGDEFDNLTPTVKARVLSQINKTSFDEKIDDASSFIDDLEEAKGFVEDHKLNDELTAEIAEDVITLDNAVDGRVKDIVEVLIDKTMTEKIQEADDYLTELANEFIEKHYLNELANNEVAAEVIKELNNTNPSSTPNQADELTKEMAQDIVKDETTEEFEGLTPTVQERVLENTLSSTKFENIVAGAQAFLDDTEAEEFIKDNKLNEDFTKSTANNIVNNLEKNYNKLSSDNVRDLVDEKLGKTPEEIIEEAKEFLDRTAAQEFYDNYLDGLDEEKIVSGEDAWNNSSERVKEFINDLLEDNNVDSTYPELLEKAKETLNNRAAEKFINDYLTEENGKVIGQVNNSNYKKVIKAAEPYEALSEEVKAIVNSKLKASVNTTYPELLSAAQAIEKSPKTGDMSGIMIGVLIVSVIGIVAVIKKRK